MTIIPNLLISRLNQKKREIENGKSAKKNQMRKSASEFVLFFDGISSSSLGQAEHTPPDDPASHEPEIFPYKWSKYEGTPPLPNLGLLVPERCITLLVNPKWKKHF